MTSTTTTVFVSGVDGYIAQHILIDLLNKGYKVIGSVRSSSKGDDLIQKLQDVKLPFENFKYVVVPEIGTPGAFDNALKENPDISVFLHTASPFRLDVTDIEQEILLPAINGIKNALLSAEKYASNLKHFVITSSFAAIGGFGKYEDPNKVYTERDWNPQTWEESLSDPLEGYLGSKKFAEQAAWELWAETDAGFQLTSVNPPYVFGPQAFGVKDSTQMNTSVETVNALLKMNPKDSIPGLKHLFVDVRDVSKAHLEAFENPEAVGKRFFITNGQWSYQGMANIIHENFKELTNVPVGEPEKDEVLKKEAFKFDNSKTMNVLHTSLIPFEQSIIDTVEQIVAAC